MDILSVVWGYLIAVSFHCICKGFVREPCENYTRVIRMLPSGQSLNKPAAVAVVCLRYLDICVGHILDHAGAYFVEDFWTC